MDKDMTITANFDLMNVIRLKTGTGLNPGATINFVALSLLQTRKVQSYRKKFQVKKKSYEDSTHFTQGYFFCP